MGNSRPRYNQKGRGGDPNLAPPTATKRPRATSEEEDEILHQQEEEELQDATSSRNKKIKRAEAKQLEAAEPKMSSKKRKRMDAYVARKLKKDDRKDLIASLATTQTTNLNLRSSSALGSKQFSTQNARVDHAKTVEESRRGRALKILVDQKGKGGGYISGSGSESGEEELGDQAMDDNERLISPPPQLPPVVSAAKPLQLFNASGVVDVIEVSQQPVASTSTPATLVVGSGLKEGAVVRIVKRKPKTKKKGKGKGKMVEESESDFNSSDSSADEGDGEPEEGADASDAESWYGIDGNKEDLELPPSPGSGISGSEEEDSDEDEDDEDDDEDDDEQDSSRPARTKGSFQSWAESQLLSASRRPSSPPAPKAFDNNSMPYDEYIPLLPAGSGVIPALSQLGPLGHILESTELPSIPLQKSFNVVFERTENVQKEREELPVAKEEERIMEAIRGNSVVIISAETGSGKTTQVGQFLLEGGWGDKRSDNPGMIAITQPRRVAALSTSARVRAELCLPLDSTVVAHRIRYSSTTAPDTKLVFMTDGVLLRELASDFLLKKYSVVVIDEAHERGVNTDVLIGVLSRVARLREEMWLKSKDDGIKPLRLIIMSATLRVSDFAENATLFPKPPPIIHISARQHPVTIHFSRKTSPHYLEQAYKKVARIHARLPAGGILVFCTGQNEIISLCKKLEAKFGEKAVRERKEKLLKIAERNLSKEERKTEKKEAKEVEGEVELGDDVEVEEIDLGDRDEDLAADVDDGIGILDDDPDDLESSDDEDTKIKGVDMEEDTDEPLYILPLYSLLPTEKQMKVFEAPPPGMRLVVIATNVAETAITIPNIKYVVDAGRAKERRFDPDSGIQSFEISWISKASASQRVGRAGRTGPGHCYRLYSSSVFESYFDEHTKPEILRMPIEGVVLQMKSMNIDAVANFPFPTPPDRESLRRAEKTLVHLGALEASDSSSKVGGKITELGRAMALFPLSPRFSKMIVAGQQHGCLPYVIAIVCALSVGDPFIREASLGDEEDSTPDLAADRALTAAEIMHIRDPALRAKEELKVSRRAFFDVQNKYLALGKGTSDVFKVLSVVGAYEYEGGRDSFCPLNFVRAKAMQEIHKLRSQISKIVQSTYPGIDAGFVPKLQPPSDIQLKILRQLITSAFIDQVAVRKDLVEKGTISYSKVDSTRGVPYRTAHIDEDLFIHPSSGLFHHSPPEFLVYQDVHRTTKVWLKTVTKINPAWLPVLGKPLCTFSKPLETPTMTLAAAGSSKAKDAGDTRQSFVIPRFAGIELKPILAEQKLVKGRWVFV